MSNQVSLERFEVILKSNTTLTVRSDRDPEEVSDGFWDVEILSSEHPLTNKCFEIGSHYFLNISEIQAWRVAI